MSKKERIYYDTIIENAIFDFSKGRLIRCHSESDIFNSIVLYPTYKLNRIGEIALVSQSSPLANTGEFYDSSLLDENTGCHFALGNSISDCIGIKKEKFMKKSAQYYHYNTSDFHTDLIFGDSSITVEAETTGRKKY